VNTQIHTHTHVHSGIRDHRHANVGAGHSPATCGERRAALAIWAKRAGPSPLSQQNTSTFLVLGRCFDRKAKGCSVSNIATASPSSRFTGGFSWPSTPLRSRPLSRCTLSTQFSSSISVETNDKCSVPKQNMLITRFCIDWALLRVLTNSHAFPAK